MATTGTTRKRGVFADRGIIPVSFIHSNLYFKSMTNTIIARDVFGNEYSHDVEALTQTIRVYAIVERDGKFLVTKQWDGVSLPGGGVEKGETLEATVVREVQEETGLTITLGNLFYNTSRFFQRNKDSQPVQAFMFFFTGEYVSGEISNTSITASETTYTNGVAEWIAPADFTQDAFRHSVSLEEIMDAYNSNTFKK